MTSKSDPYGRPRSPEAPEPDRDAPAPAPGLDARAGRPRTGEAPTIQRGGDISPLDPSDSPTRCLEGLEERPGPEVIAWCPGCEAKVTVTSGGCARCERELEPRADRLIGELLADSFLVLELLGRGGMGVVYRARQVAIDRDVALKLLPPPLVPDRVAVDRFKSEARRASEVRHPNVAAIYDFGELEDGSLYIAMEYVSGRSLRQVLRDEGALDPERAVRLMSQLADVVAAAHELGIVHRDLKPENVMVDPGNVRGERAVLLDFGISKVVTEDAESITLTGTILGTPQYMSPEQCLGSAVDARSDVYALGVVLYELLTGRPPFIPKGQDGSVVSILTSHLRDPPPPMHRVNPNVTLSASLSRLVMETLAKKPEARPNDAAVFHDRLVQLGSYVGTRTPGSNRPLLTPTRLGADRSGPHVDVLPPPPTPGTDVGSGQHRTASRRRRQARESAAEISPTVRWLGALALVGAATASLVLDRPTDGGVQETSSSAAAPSPARQARPIYEAGSQAVAAGDYTRAGKLFEQIGEIDPTSSLGSLGLGRIEHELGRPLAALTRLDRAILLARRRPDEKPELGEARRIRQEIIDTDRLFHDAEREATDGSLARAEELYRLYLVERPWDAKARILRGRMLLELKRPDEALAELRRAAELAPDSADARHELGVALLAAGDPQAAVTELEAALRIEPGRADSARHLSIASRRAR